MKELIFIILLLFFAYDYNSLDLVYDVIPEDYPMNYQISPEIGIYNLKTGNLDYFIKISNNYYLNLDNLHRLQIKTGGIGNSFITLRSPVYNQNHSIDELSKCNTTLQSTSNATLSNTKIPFRIKINTSLPGRPITQNIYYGFIHNNPICDVEEVTEQCNVDSNCNLGSGFNMNPTGNGFVNNFYKFPPYCGIGMWDKIVSDAQSNRNWIEYKERFSIPDTTRFPTAVPNDPLYNREDEISNWTIDDEIHNINIYYDYDKKLFIYHILFGGESWDIRDINSGYSENYNFGNGIISDKGININNFPLSYDEERALKDSPDRSDSDSQSHFYLLKDAITKYENFKKCYNFCYDKKDRIGQPIINNIKCLNKTDPKVSDTKSSIYVDLNGVPIENEVDDYNNFINTNDNIFVNEEPVTSKFINKLIYREVGITGYSNEDNYKTVISSEIYLRRYKLDIGLIDLLFSTSRNGNKKFLFNGLKDYIFKDDKYFYQTIFEGICIFPKKEYNSFNYDIFDEPLFLTLNKTNSRIQAYKHGISRYKYISPYEYHNPPIKLYTLSNGTDKAGTYLYYNSQYSKISDDTTFLNEFTGNTTTETVLGVAGVVSSNNVDLTQDMYNKIISLNLNYNQLTWDQLGNDFTPTNSNDMISFTYIKE